MKRGEFFSKIIDMEWAIAYRKKDHNHILDAEKLDFTIINNTMRYWCADPFLVEVGNKTYVFFEAYHRFKRKGAIGFREISGKKKGKINIVIDEPFHLSYPFLYIEGDVWYMIPESKESNQIIRYKSEEFPEKWVKEKVLMDNISAADTTIHFYENGCMKLITYLSESFNKGKLMLLQLKDDVCETIYQLEDPDGRKRPAGKIFMRDNIFYRPSQLCTRAYGEALIFNKMLAVTENSYEEEEYKVIGIEDIHLDRTEKISGIHTYNSSKNWEVIDVEMTGFSVIRIIFFIPRVYQYLKKKLAKRKTKQRNPIIKKGDFS